MNELQVAYQAFSSFLEETLLGNMCTPGIPFHFQGSVMDTQGGGAERRGLGSSHKAGPPRLWNLVGRMPGQGQQGRT